MPCDVRVCRGSFTTAVVICQCYSMSSLVGVHVKGMTDIVAVGTREGWARTAAEDIIVELSAA